MNIKCRFIFPLILITILLVSAGSTWALTASNTQIINQASLSYNDGISNRTVNALPVVVTVTTTGSAFTVLLLMPSLYERLAWLMIWVLDAGNAQVLPALTSRMVMRMSGKINLHLMFMSVYLGVLSLR